MKAAYSQRQLQWPHWWWRSRLQGSLRSFRNQAVLSDTGTEHKPEPKTCSSDLYLMCWQSWKSWLHVSPGLEKHELFAKMQNNIAMRGSISTISSLCCNRFASSFLILHIWLLQSLCQQLLSLASVGTESARQQTVLSLCFGDDLWCQFFSVTMVSSFSAARIIFIVFILFSKDALFGKWAWLTFLNETLINVVEPYWMWALSVVTVLILFLCLPFFALLLIGS